MEIEMEAEVVGATAAAYGRGRSYSSYSLCDYGTDEYDTNNHSRDDVSCAQSCYSRGSGMVRSDDGDDISYAQSYYDSGRSYADRCRILFGRFVQLMLFVRLLYLNLFVCRRQRPDTSISVNSKSLAHMTVTRSRGAYERRPRLVMFGILSSILG